jgi:methylase of polypeptide subunit release factors
LTYGHICFIQHIERLFSAVPAALVTAASVAANNRTNAQKLITALGTGSGVDVASLAQNLTDAERVP